jgi:hypothetical protein
MLYPISYSIPEELIVPYVPFKICHTASHEYQFTDSHMYLKNYKNAIFGDTRLKCGWDCFRHYEILSQGTIPFFHNLEKCPPLTLHNFPKQKIIELRDLYGPMTFDEIMKTSSSHLYNNIDELLNLTKSTLTTKESAKYILSKTNTPSTKRVLFLDNVETKGEYLTDMLAHGTYRLTDGEVHIYPDHAWRYTSYSDSETQLMYGKGFNYTRLLEKQYIHTSDEILENIQQRYYDHVIVLLQCYSNTPVPFLITHENNIFKYYNSSEISFVCGNDCDPYWSPELNWYIRDRHYCPLKILSTHNNIFIRELGDM